MNKSEEILLKKYFYLTGEGKKVYDIDLIKEDFEEVIYALEQLNKLNKQN
jgi:hypothetical protein